MLVLEFKVTHTTHKLPALVGFHVETQPPSAFKTFSTYGATVWKELIEEVRVLVVHCWDLVIISLTAASVTNLVIV